MKSIIIVISALLFLVIAAAHAFRAYEHLDIAITCIKGTVYHLPILASWICAGVTALLGILLLVVRK